MGAKSVKTTGVANIYRANTYSHAIFFASRQATIDDPKRELTEIVRSVISNFGIEMTVEAALREYYRVLNAYLDNGGI